MTEKCFNALRKIAAVDEKDLNARLLASGTRRFYRDVMRRNAESAAAKERVANTGWFNAPSEADVAAANTELTIHQGSRGPHDLYVIANAKDPKKLYNRDVTDIDIPYDRTLHQLLPHRDREDTKPFGATRNIIDDYKDLVKPSRSVLNPINWFK